MSNTNGWNILVLAGGSGGDVYPPLAIAKRLRERGHRVLFLTNPFFEPAARRAGLEFAGLGTAEEYLAVIQNPELWKFGKGFKILFDVMLKKMPDDYRAIVERYVPGETVLVAPGGMLGARLANEKLGIPLVQFHVETLALRSLNEQPGVVLPAYLKPVIRPLRRLLIAGLDRWVIDPRLGPRLNAFRAELGLPPVSRVLNQWIYSPQVGIGLFPDWFVAPQPDWPPNTHLTGFVLFDQAENQESPRELTRFLDSGDPPIVFTLGTAIPSARRFFEVSVEVCRLMGRRGLFLTPFRDQVPADLPESVRHFEYVPFSRVLPRAAVLVHHGGIGTMAQAFAAGIPQLAVPFNFDHPANAAHLRQLGSGDSIAQRAYQPRRAVEKLEALLKSPAVAQKCRQLKAKMEQTDAVGEACRLIESMDDAALARRASTVWKLEAQREAGGSLS